MTKPAAPCCAKRVMKNEQKMMLPPFLLGEPFPATMPSNPSSTDTKSGRKDRARGILNVMVFWVVFTLLNSIFYVSR